MSTLDKLRAELTSMCEALPFRTHFALLDCDTGAVIGQNEEEPVPAASTRKVPILMACLRLASRGQLDLGRPVVIEERHQKNDSGCLRFLRPGLVLSVQDALTLMIIVSDNCCTAALLELVGLEEINRFSADVGMLATRHVAAAPSDSRLDLETPENLSNVNSTSSTDMTALLAKIVRGASDERAARALGCTTDHCALALSIMSGQQLRGGLPKLLPTGTVVANKTGVSPSAEADVGVIFDRQTPLFVVSAYVTSIPVLLRNGKSGRARARDHIAELSWACWRMLAP